MPKDTVLLGKKKKKKISSKIKIFQPCFTCSRTGSGRREAALYFNI